MFGQREVHGDGLRAGADLDRHAMVLQQQAKLFEVVIGKEIGPRDGDLESAGAGHETVAQTRIGTRHGAGAHAHERVAGAHGLAVVFASHEAAQAVAKVLDAAAVDGLHLGQRRLGVVEPGGGDEKRQ